MTTTTTSTRERTPATAADVRAWARSKGIEVGNRGHLPEKVVREYNRTHRRFYQSRNPRVHDASSNS